MKILLIAYEFPPSVSPQSLRWAYLTNRLAELGHEVHVLTPDLAGSMEGLPDPGPDVQVHRTWPGPVGALLGRLARRRPAASINISPRASASRPSTENAEGFSSACEPGSVLDSPSPAEPPRLNWKGRLLERVQKLVSWFLFPDLRAEWKSPAMLVLPELLARLEPDVVVSSHEPATTLELGLEAKRLGYRWVADLGDPVLAPYTPQRWRRRARLLERRVMREADHVIITAEQAHDLLRDRHGEAAVAVTTVTQGFDEQLPPLPRHKNNGNDEGPLELLYAGRFYSFRDPRGLITAVLAVTGVRLNIAGSNVPRWLHAAAKRYPTSIRLLGRVPHRNLLLLQRQADVLINLANRDPCQIPGKFYEYLGAARPILHMLSGEEHDATAELLAELERGWSCTPATVVQTLELLVTLHQQGELHRSGAPRPAIEQWSWSANALRLERALRSVVTPAA